MCLSLVYTLPCSCSTTYAHLPVLAVIMRPDALHHLDGITDLLLLHSSSREGCMLAY
jgi:hypothetical protein